MAKQCSVQVPETQNLIPIYLAVRIFPLCLGRIPAYDKVWFIGDEFMTKSYAQHFQNAYVEKDSDFTNLGYVKSHYDTYAICNGSLTKNMNG